MRNSTEDRSAGRTRGASVRRTSESSRTGSRARGLDTLELRKAPEPGDERYDAPTGHACPRSLQAGVAARAAATLILLMTCLGATSPSWAQYIPTTTEAWTGTLTVAKHGQSSTSPFYNRYGYQFGSDGYGTLSNNMPRLNFKRYTIWAVYVQEQYEGRYQNSGLSRDDLVVALLNPIPEGQRARYSLRTQPTTERFNFADAVESRSGGAILYTWSNHRRNWRSGNTVQLAIEEIVPVDRTISDARLKTVEGGPNTLELTWTTNEDRLLDEYEVWYRVEGTSGNQRIRPGPDETSLTLRFLEPDTEYTVQIRPRFNTRNHRARQGEWSVMRARTAAARAGQEPQVTLSLPEGVNSYRQGNQRVVRLSTGDVARVRVNVSNIVNSQEWEMRPNVGMKVCAEEMWRDSTDQVFERIEGGCRADESLGLPLLSRGFTWTSPTSGYVPMAKTMNSSAVQDGPYRIRLGPGADYRVAGITEVCFQIENNDEEVPHGCSGQPVLGPVLDFAYVEGNGNTVGLQFKKILDGENLPPKSAFSITVDGTPSSIDGVSTRHAFLFLTGISPTITRGQTVIVSYADPRAGDDANAIQDRDGHDAGSFSLEVANNSGQEPTSEGRIAEPFYAEFQDVPENHDGSTAFTVTLDFSEPPLPGVTDATFAGSAGTPSVLQVANGRVTGARQVVPGEPNTQWEITVEPTGNDAISITLPVRRNCAAANAVCAGVNRPIAETATATIDGPTATLPDEPFSVSLRNVPLAHDGDTAFKFEVHFSKNPKPYGYNKLRTKTLKVRQGTTTITPTRARRLQQGSNQGWEVTVQPQSRDEISISIGRTTDCSDDGAVCTDSTPPQMLSIGVGTLVAGPPGLSIADARGTEGTDAAINFAVTLSRPVAEQITVEYATSDGTAQAPADYDAAVGVLLFGPGETSKTVSVGIVDDAHDDNGEIFTVTLSNPSGGNAWLADATATGTIENADHMPSAWLSRFGRTVASQAVDAIGGRMQGDGAAHVTIGGQTFSSTGDDASERSEDAVRVLDPLAPDQAPGTMHSMSGQELLLGSSFQLSSGGDSGSPAWTAWGEVATSGFEAEVDDTRLDGNVTSGFLGADVGTARWLAGVAMSLSEGDGDYGLIDNDTGGEVESSLTTVYPYGKLALSNTLDVWALAGLGQGDLTLTHTPEGAAKQVYRPEIDMQMGAIGTRGEVLSPTEDGGLSIAIKSDALWVRTTSDAVRGSDGNLEAAETDVSRLRLLVEGSRSFDTGGGTLTPTLEIGVRHDGGDAETGTGLEAGAGLRYSGNGLTIEGNVHTLIAHEENGYEEWGASGSVRIDPGTSGRGLSFSLTPSWGAASSGTERLWSVRDTSGLAQGSEFDAESRLETELGYGLGLRDGRGVVTPFAGMTLGDGRTIRTGARWQVSPDAAFGLEAHRETGDEAETGLRLEARLRF